MKFTLYTFFIIFFLSICSCNTADNYDSKSKSLDSLSGALNTMLLSMQKMDTALLGKALDRYTHYQQFINQNGTDTLSKTEADQFRKFVESGLSLKAIESNRHAILERGSRVNSQLSSLSADIKQHAVKREELNSLSQQEITQTNKLIIQGYDQQKIFFSAIEELKNALPAVEQIIRRKNKGELPMVITNSEAL